MNVLQSAFDDLPLPRFGCSFLVATLLRYASAKDCGERRDLTERFSLALRHAVTALARFFNDPKFYGDTNGLTAQESLQALVGRFFGLPFPVDGKQQGNARKQIWHNVRFGTKAAIVQPAPATNE